MLRPVLVYALIAKAIALVLWWAHYPRSALLVFVGPDPFVLYAIFAPSAQGLVRVFTRFVPQRPAVWLTIDDGPDEHDTLHILDLLDRHGAQATFFVIGENAARLPHPVTELVRLGHKI